MRLFAVIEAQLLSQRGHLFPWAPVFLAIGIGGFFSLRFDPGSAHYAVFGVFAALTASLAWRWPERWGYGWSALWWGVALAVLGFCLAGARAHVVADPALSWRYYGPIEGRVVSLDRSSSDALRMTLDQVRLERTAPERVPGRVRVSLHGNPDIPQPGAQVMTTGHLMPPQGPAEPGGFDFRRHAWFQGIGAVGYTRKPVLRITPAQPESLSLRIFTLRMAASARIREVLDGDIGGFAAAITTGDRSGVRQAPLQALRDSNLAHLLAISGLHMGLLAGFVFAVVRAGFVAKIWLENDGDPSNQQQAAKLWAGEENQRKSWKVGPVELVHLIGKRAASDFGTCDADQIVVTSVPASIDGPCEVFDLNRLRETGALKLSPNGLETAREISGVRLWTGR